MLTYKQSRRGLSISSVCLAVIALAWALASGATAATKLPTAAAAAKACAGKVSISQKLGAGDMKFLQSYVPCVTAKLRGAKLTTNAKVTTLAQADLNTFTADKVTQVAAATKAATNGNGKSFCAKTHMAVVELADSTPPPALTPLLIADNTTKTLGLENGTGRSAKAVFGFAYGSQILFHDAGSTDGISFVGVIINCGLKS